MSKKILTIDFSNNELLKDRPLCPCFKLVNFRPTIFTSAPQ